VFIKIWNCNCSRKISVFGNCARRARFAKIQYLIKIFNIENWGVYSLENLKFSGISFLPEKWRNCHGILFKLGEFLQKILSLIILSLYYKQSANQVNYMFKIYYEYWICSTYFLLITFSDEKNENFMQIKNTYLPKFFQYIYKSTTWNLRGSTFFSRTNKRH